MARFPLQCAALMAALTATSAALFWAGHRLNHGGTR
jgi:hypothetical protein